MWITFVSNYINHHQIPFCREMLRLTGGQFVFVQTEPMEQERVQMGWQQVELPFVKLFYEDPEQCRALIMDSDVVIFGGCEEESYIVPRLAAGKIVIRYSERLYKTGQWKAVSPRGLRKKYHDHTRYRKAPVYLLCSGAYVPSDFHIVRSYPGKMFCWGYFPETKHYDLQQLMSGKGYGPEGEKKLPYILWAGRFIDWKHPELVVETAEYLKKKGISFHLDMIGGGPLEEEIRRLITERQVEDCVTLAGYKTPEQVREYMEMADIYLLTSDRQEGWGAVANEAMNSGCALVADHMVGAVPYLVRHGQNGFVYKSGCKDMLFETVEKLLVDCALRQRIGKEAYETIVSTWNAEHAAGRLYELIEQLVSGTDTGEMEKTESKSKAPVPCMPAPIISERRMFSYLTKGKKRE